MTAKRQDQKYWLAQLDRLIENYSDDPTEQALYARGLMSAWLARLASEYYSVRQEILARLEEK
jgi:hypothetical protein